MYFCVCFAEINCIKTDKTNRRWLRLQRNFRVLLLHKDFLGGVYLVCTQTPGRLGLESMVKDSSHLAGASQEIRHGLELTGAKVVAGGAVPPPMVWAHCCSAVLLILGKRFHSVLVSLNPLEPWWRQVRVTKKSTLWSGGRGPIFGLNKCMKANGRIWKEKDSIMYSWWSPHYTT
jgi:hypothetical protein